MKSAWISQHRDSFPVAVMCGVLLVSTSGDYGSLGRRPSSRAERHQRIQQAVQQVHAESYGIYGSHKVARVLHDRDDLESACRNTVAATMRELGLTSCVRKTFQPTTTQADPAKQPAANKLAQDFTADAPNHKWVTDITYLPTTAGWVDLAVVVDLFRRKVVGWSLSTSLATELVCEALRPAIESRRPQGRQLLHHSDRGCQSTSEADQQTLRRLGIECSMSRTGCCYDNAAMERFFWSLKHEWTNHTTYHNLEDVRRSVFLYIESFYNPVRLHQTLGYLIRSRTRPGTSGVILPPPESAITGHRNMPPTDFPQPTFWLSYGDFVWFLGYCLGCIAVAILVVWKSCFPKSRLRWGFVSIVALWAAIVVPLVLPHQTEPYAQSYLLLAYSLVLLFLVCGIKSLVEYRDDDPNRIAKVRFGAVLLQNLLLTLVIGGFQDGGPSAPTSVPHCKNNLKQIGLALYNRADDLAGSGKPRANEGMPPMSWRVALLPYIDRATLRRQYRDDLPWDDPANLEIARTTESSLVCPSAPALEDPQKRKFTSYALVTGLGTECPEGQSLDSIKLDVTNQTAIVIEACGRNIVWTEPRDVDVSVETMSLNQRGPRPLESPSLGSSLHRRGVNVLRADGSVRTMPLNTDPKVLKALMTSDRAVK